MTKLEEIATVIDAYMGRSMNEAMAAARAAVEAMREPTRDMLMMGQEEVLISFDEASRISTYASAAEIENAWEAMIDSILGSTPS